MNNTKLVNELEQSADFHSTAADNTRNYVDKVI
jgi:hypothetical protein